MFEKLSYIVLGVLISWLAYFVKRRIENKPQLETLDKHKKLLDIHKQMNDQGIDIEGLTDLEKKLTGKIVAINEKNIEFQKKSTSLVESSDSEEVSQKVLNQRAAFKVHAAKHRLQKALAGIDSRVSDIESQLLMNSQSEWESYSVSQAEAAASSYREGTIYPLIYLSELESLVNERTVRR